MDFKVFVLVTMLLKLHSCRETEEAHNYNYTPAYRAALVNRLKKWCRNVKSQIPSSIGNVKFIFN